MASCLPLEGEMLMVFRLLWSAMCPHLTSGRWKLPWRCPAAVTPALSLMARSLCLEVTSTMPTPGRCVLMTPPLTPGRIRAVWAHLEAGTVPPLRETELMLSVAVSWAAAGRGWMSLLSNLTTLTMGSGATAHLFTQEWAQPVLPFWTTRCISSEAGMRGRRSTRNAFRFITLISMNGLRMTSCQKLQLASHAVLSTYRHGKHGSPEPVRFHLHQSVYKGLDNNDVVYMSKGLQHVWCIHFGFKIYQLSLLWRLKCNN